MLQLLNSLIGFIEKNIIIIDKPKHTWILCFGHLEHFDTNVRISSSVFKEIAMKHLIINVPMLEFSLQKI